MQVNLMNENRLANVKHATKEGLLSETASRFYERTFRWEIQCGKVELCKMENRRIAAMVSGLIGLISGVNRRRMIGWLLWSFSPGFFTFIQRWRKR